MTRPRFASWGGGLSVWDLADVRLEIDSSFKHPYIFMRYSASRAVAYPRREMKRLLPLAVLLAFTVGDATAAAGADTATTRMKDIVEAKRQPSDIEGIDWVASYEPGPLRTAYRAETEIGVAPDDSYAVRRDANQGLVVLKGQQGRRVKQYTIPGVQIRAVVHVRYDMPVLDRADLVFTDRPGRNLVLVHTTTANGGIFTGSDVYPISYRDGKAIDSRHLIKDPALLSMVEMAVSVYRYAAAGERLGAAGTAGTGLMVTGVTTLRFR